MQYPHICWLHIHRVNHSRTGIRLNASVMKIYKLFFLIIPETMQPENDLQSINSVLRIVSDVKIIEADETLCSVVQHRQGYPWI